MGFTSDGKLLWVLFSAANKAEKHIFRLEAMQRAEPWAFKVVAVSWEDVDITGIVIDAVDAART